MPKTTFVLATYGARYAPFLFAAVSTILEHMPRADILVVWSDTPALEREMLAGLSDRIVLVETGALAPIVENGGLDQIISQKMRYWLAAMEVVAGGTVVFLDTDTLLVAPIDDVLAEDFDLAITYRDKGHALNTGVVAVRCDERTRRFVRRWADRTTAILSDPVAAEAAVRENGGADQQALVDVGGYRRQREPYRAGDVLIRPFPCSELNEIRCVPVSDRLRVFHLKGRWHPIVLDGRPFDESRPAESCSHILELWLRHYRRVSTAALARYLERTVAAVSDPLRRVGGLAHRLGVDRLVLVAPQGTDAAAVAARLGYDGRIDPVAAPTSEAMMRRIRGGTPGLVVWNAPEADAAVACGAMIHNLATALICTTLPRPAHDRTADFPYYRSADFGTAAVDGETRPVTVSVPTVLDFAHRRRGSDWGALRRAAS